MSPEKEAVLKLVEAIPDDDAESESEILYRLYVKAKVAEGMKAYREGRYLSLEEANTRIDQWLSRLVRSCPKRLRTNHRVHQPRFADECRKGSESDSRFAGEID